MKKKKFIKRVEFWRRKLAPEWRLTVVIDAPLEEDTNAQVSADTHYEHATVEFSRGLLKKHPGEIDKTIVHELLHLVCREFRRTLDLVEAHIGAAALDVLTRRAETEEEQLVERMARVICSYEWPGMTVVYGTMEDY